MGVNKKTYTPEEKAARKVVVIRLIILILVSAALFAVYRVAMILPHPVFPIVLTTYVVAFTAVIVAYLIYNRCMVRRNVTVEMLPDDWSDEKKTEYVEDGKRRLKRSSWMLMLILAFTFTFVFEMFELYVLPFLDSILE